MMKTLGALTALMILAAVGVLMMAGCESTSTTSSVITVTPANADLTVSNKVQVFTASMTSSNGLILPLIWEVSDTKLGTIKSSVGASAIYESSGAVGYNTITVRDQASSEGMAIAKQK